MREARRGSSTSWKPSRTLARGTQRVPLPAHTRLSSQQLLRVSDSCPSFGDGGVFPPLRQRVGFLAHHPPPGLAQSLWHSYSPAAGQPVHPRCSGAQQLLGGAPAAPAQRELQDAVRKGSRGPAPSHPGDSQEWLTEGNQRAQSGLLSMHSSPQPRSQQRARRAQGGASFPPPTFHPKHPPFALLPPPFRPTTCVGRWNRQNLS